MLAVASDIMPGTYRLLPWFGMQARFGPYAVVRLPCGRVYATFAASVQSDERTASTFIPFIYYYLLPSPWTARKLRPSRGGGGVAPLIVTCTVNFECLLQCS